MTYWKEKCFGVSAEALVDLAVDLRAVGGIYGGNNRATEFLCLTLKLLQIQPEKEIILEFIKNEDHKYVRLLGAFYMRLVGKPTDVYQYLEPLLNDYRKVRYRSKDGKYALTHVDEFVHNLLTKDMFLRRGAAESAASSGARSRGCARAESQRARGRHRRFRGTIRTSRGRSDGKRDEDGCRRRRGKTDVGGRRRCGGDW